MRLKLILLILLGGANLHSYGQNQNTSKNAIGSDFIPFVGIMTGQKVQAPFELIYKRRFVNGEFRVKLFANSYYKTDPELFFGFSSNVDRFSTSEKQQSKGFSIGYAFYKPLPKLNTYFGADLYYNLEEREKFTGFRVCDDVLDPACVSSIEEQTRQPGIGLIPFVGFSVPISDKIDFALEIGLDFQFNSSETSTTSQGETLRSIRSLGLDISGDHLINDLAFYFNF